MVGCYKFVGAVSYKLVAHMNIWFGSVLNCACSSLRVCSLDSCQLPLGQCVLSPLRVCSFRQPCPHPFFCFLSLILCRIAVWVCLLLYFLLSVFGAFARKCLTMSGLFGFGGLLCGVVGWLTVALALPHVRVGWPGRLLVAWMVFCVAHSRSISVFVSV